MGIPTRLLPTMDIVSCGRCWGRGCGCFGRGLVLRPTIILSARGGWTQIEKFGTSSMTTLKRRAGVRRRPGEAEVTDRRLLGHKLTEEVHTISTIP